MTTLTATYNAWAPTAAQVTSVAGSDFIIQPPFNPAARSGYAWPSVNATYVPWAPARTLATPGATHNLVGAPCSQSASCGTAAVVVSGLLSVIPEQRIWHVPAQDPFWRVPAQNGMWDAPAQNRIARF